MTQSATQTALQHESQPFPVQHVHTQHTAHPHYALIISASRQVWAYTYPIGSAASLSQRP